jgi:hypothetical protein
MKRMTATLITILLTGAISIFAMPANAVPLPTQNPGVRFDGDPSIGGTVYVNVTDAPETSTTTYKWTSGKKTVATTSTFVIPNTMVVGSPLQVSVTNTAPGYAKWSFLSPIIKVGQITLLKTGVKTGNFAVNSSTVIGDDLLFPPQYTAQGIEQVRSTTEWKVDAAIVATSRNREITPTSDQVGKIASMSSTYTFGTLPQLKVTHESGKVIGLIGVENNGALSNKDLVGEIVSIATLPQWAVTPDKVTYQWFRDGITISGQKKSTYKFVLADWHRRISVKITATKANYVPRVVELSRNGVLKEVSVTTAVTDGSNAWVGCEAFDLQNILCMPAGANPKWMGAINMIHTQDDMLYVSFSVPKPQPSGSLVHWQAKVVGISSMDLYPLEATGQGSEFAIDNPKPLMFAKSVNQKKDSIWNTEWFTALPDASQNLNFGLIALDTGSFVIKSVQITAVYHI